MTKSVFTSNDVSSPFLVEIDCSNKIQAKKSCHPLPLFCGALDSPATIRATITFEAEKDYVANGVEILFMTEVTTDTFEPSRQVNAVRQTRSPMFSKDTICSQAWTMPVHTIEAGIIAKGRYSKTVAVTMDPALPSSSLHPQSTVRHFFKIYFSHQLTTPKRWDKVLANSWVEKDIWVLNSTLAPPSSINLPAANEHAKAHAVLTEALLPVTFSSPKTLQLGQGAALTVKVHPFQKGSPLEGQEANILSIQFTVLETRRLRDKRNENKTPDNVIEVLKIGLPKDGWPKSKDGWEKTFHLTLPSSPELSVDTLSKYLDIFHELMLTITLKTKPGSLFKKTEECNVKLEVNVVAPRPAADRSLPHYSASPEDRPRDDNDSHNNGNSDLGSRGRDEKRGFREEPSTAPGEDLPEYTLS